ncbi:solute carrier family 22 member 8 isoform X4 [Zalophus californianus]|uniref:Solute carrier family 22 member 8 isoform X4 n=1 Tax=Zalophus californianus TaxID=9704 RepID=A0A6J2BXT2_ZALCA|nr:solute carrier family 22 member 8 isoform X4 [Zalophus californianus]
MAFSELMDRVGSKGPFQFLNTILLSLPILGLANHYLLQIFTATTPDHHCRPPPNASTGPWVLPKGLNGKAEKCLRFIDPPNATMPNDTQGATEPCLDGWAYDLSTADSIVTEEAAQGRMERWIYRIIQLSSLEHAVPSPGSTCLGLGPRLLAKEDTQRWIPESVRWMVLSGKFSKALKILRQIAALNGKKEEGKKLSVEELKLIMQKEISLAKAKYSIVDLFRTPNMRRVTCCLSLAWFSTGFGYYSLAMGVEEFGVNLYILQLIFGGVDIPAKFITVLSINYLGRHVTQAGSLLLAGGSILAIIFVPSDLQTLRTVLAVFGKGCLSSSFSCLFLYTTELYPTVIRQTGMGISNLWTRAGSMSAPLVKITGELQPFIPSIIFGTVTLLGGSAAYFLPETLNRPLPETIQDMETWSWRAKKPKQEPEAEKASQRIPLQSCGPGLDPS